VADPILSRRAVAALMAAAPFASGLGLAAAVQAAPIDPATPLRPAATPDDEATSAATGADAFRHITAQVTINGRGPFTFLVDTGANRSAVSEAVAEQLGLTLGAPVRVYTVLGARSRPTVLLDELRIGGRAQHGVRVPTLAMTGVSADGVLGVDWLRNRRLTFFFDENRLEIAGSTLRTAFEGDTLRGSSVVIPALLRAGQLTVINAQAGPTPIVAMVDTGAQLTIGNPALRAQVERQLGPTVQPLRIGISTVTGERIEGDLYTLPSLRVGGALFSRVPVVFANVRVFDLWEMQRQPAVVLGLDLMARFDAVSLDFGRRQVQFNITSGQRRRLTREADRQPPAPAGKRGAL
jgi:predicted aspartyl protease